MKNLNKIGKSILMLFIILQVNNTKANEVNIDELATKIAKSQSGNDYLSAVFANTFIMTMSGANKSENEKTIIKEKIDRISKLSNEEYTLELKEEFAKMLGFKNYEMFRGLKSTRLDAYQKLIGDFPEIATLNTSDKSILFEKVSLKIDVNSMNFDNLKAANVNKCIRNAIKVWGACMLPGAAGITIAKFVGCVLFAEAAETVASDGVAVVVAPAVAATDARICAWIVGVSLTNVGGCSLAYIARLEKCE